MSPGSSIRRVRPCSAGWLLLLLGLAAGRLNAQQVRYGEDPRTAEEHRLAALVAHGSFELLVRDTVLEAGTRIEGHVLVLEAAVRLAGEVTGDVVVVDGDLFLRPGAHVSGDVFALGAGYYGSSLAAVDGRVIYRPNDRYRVLPDAGGYLILPLEELPPAIQLHGLHGFKAPRYQRVNELTLAWGVTGRIVGWGSRPSLELVGRYHTGQNEFEGTARQLWRPGGLELGVEAERVTRTNEEWARGAFSNTLSYLFVGEDFRDYYRADRVAALVRRKGGSGLLPSLTLQWEDARSLPAGDRFVVFAEDEARVNPAVDDGETWSAVGELAYRWDGPAARAEIEVLVEAADSSIAGDFSFLLGQLQVRWTGPAFFEQRFEAFALVRGDLAGTLPGQRQTGFGGRATLPTFPVLGFRGSRVVYGQVSYLFPIERFRAAALGAPAIFLRVATGAAWDEERAARFQWNLIAGARLWFLDAALALDPRESDLNPTLYALVRLGGDL